MCAHFAHFVQLAVHDVEPGSIDKLGKASMFSAAVRRAYNSGKNVLKIASHSNHEFVHPGQLGWMHSFVAAASLAYTNHLGLVLRVNHIWLCLQQALQLHLSDEAVAEKLRERIVAPTKPTTTSNTTNNKSVIHVYSESCPTVASAVEMLTSKLKGHCQPSFYQAFQPVFSIASPVEQLVSKMTMLAACKAYFTYEVETICGFPSVRLEGSLHDWKLLRRKADQLVNQYSLLGSRWWPILEYVLDKLVLARQGRVDQQFWHDMIHHQLWQGCDRTYHDINGWINAFFPLRSDLTFNKLCSCDAVFGQTGMDTHDFTTGMSSVDIVVDNQEFELNSGFVGIVVHDNHLVAQPGWYVCKTKNCECNNQPSSSLMHNNQNGANTFNTFNTLLLCDTT